MRHETGEKEMEEEITTINLKRGTLERLKSLCSRATTYDEFLNKCLDIYEKQAVNAE
jgi:hypothetical protein